MRLAAIEDRAEAELALGHHAAVAADLAPLVAAHPLRERLRGQLMLALAGSGRAAEALATFEEARQLLAEQLGTGPSDQLSAAHVAILRGGGSPSLARTAPVGRRAGTAPVGRRAGARRAGPARPPRSSPASSAGRPSLTRWPRCWRTRAW